MVSEQEKRDEAYYANVEAVARAAVYLLGRAYTRETLDGEVVCINSEHWEEFKTVIEACLLPSKKSL